MKSPIVVIALLSVALLFFSLDVASARQSKKCLSKYIGDGDCDIENNRAGEGALLGWLLNEVI